MAATSVVDHYESSDDEDPEYHKSSIDDQGESIEAHTNYTNDLASYLNQLRKEETLCDITIIINHRRFPAHKAVLCAASTYFSAMFTGGFQETSQSEITIEGSSTAFDRLLEFAYTGEIRLNADLVGDIINMASYVQFNKVAPLCSRFLKAAYAKKLIRLPDAFNILNMAKTHGFPSLQHHSEKYLATHLIEFAETFSFLKEASSEYVESVLNRKDLVLWAKEEQILKAVVAWLKQDWEERRQYAEPFLRLIRLGLVPLADLNQLIDADIQAIPECKQMIEEVEKCVAGTSNNSLSYQFPHYFASRGTVKTLLAINPAANHHHHTQCYDESGWQVLPHFPNVPFNQPFEGHRLIIAKGQLYLLGGRFMTDLIPGYARQPTLIEVCDFFFRYDMASNKWEQKESMGLARSHSAVVAFGDYIYVIGGWSSVSNVSDVQRFDLNEEKWETLSPMPVSCSIPVAVFFKNQILVYGVESSADRSQRGRLMMYDPESDKWRVLIIETLTSSSRSRRVSLAPLLVLHEEKCFRVSYICGIACVQQIIIVQDEDGKPSAVFEEPQDAAKQEDIAKRGPRAFCIGEQQFANLNGFPLKLHPWIIKQFGLSKWAVIKIQRDNTISTCKYMMNLANLIERLEKEGCCIEFDLDLYSLK